MIEMALLHPSKETPNKLRWSTKIDEDNTEFHMYIPKWRVPREWPGRIYIMIEPLAGESSQWAKSFRKFTNIEDNIKVGVEPEREHTRTIRYTPWGDKNEWPIGKPYIPRSLIPAESNLLRIEIKWDLSSKGQFIDVPTYREDIYNPFDF